MHFNGKKNNLSDFEKEITINCVKSTRGHTHNVEDKEKVKL
jgi:hypothetical protein